MPGRETAASTLKNCFYRTKLAVSRYLPNKDNLPYCLLGEQLIERRVQKQHESLRNRPLIFTISSGRAGSGYLATLLNTAGNVHAQHEPLPCINGKLLDMAMNNPPAASAGKRKIKLLGVNRSLSRLDEQTIYAETSHMFIKSFHDIILNYYDNIDVIILRRPLHKVLRSFIELGYFSNTNPMSTRWMHQPDSANSMTDMLKPLEQMDRFEKCIAYLLDIESMAQAFEKNHPDVRTHNIMLDTITEIDGAKRLFNDIGAHWTTASDKLYSSRVNTRSAYKSAVAEFVTEEYCRDRLNQYMQQALETGKSIPDIKAV